MQNHDMSLSADILLTTLEVRCKVTITSTVTTYLHS